MDPLRLPPLRFSQAESNRPLNCVLPPITPPSRFSPVSSTWPNSTQVPSPPAARHSPQISNLTCVSPDSHSPPKSLPPTSLPYVQPSSVSLPPAALLQYPTNSFDSSPTNTEPRQVSHHQDPYLRPPETQHAVQAPAKTHPAPQPAHTTYPPTMPWQYPASTTHQLPSNNPATYNAEPSYTPIPHNRTISLHERYPPTTRTASDPRYFQTRGSKVYPSTTGIISEPVSPAANAMHRRVAARSPVKRIVKTPRGLRDMYACPYPNCTRLSTEQSNMKAHMRMHTGEKPYICRHAGCKKAFRWKSSLTYHEKALHVKDRPHKCVMCRRSFVEKRKLRMHYDLCPMGKIKREEEQQRLALG